MARLHSINKYRFFDQTFELYSDDVETLSLMNVMFKRFSIADTEITSQRYEVLTKPPRIYNKDFSYIVKQPELLPSITHGIILRNTLAQIKSHLLFHAAALSYQGKGIILAADSGCGKTTLTLALLTQGFKFLSDEVAALSLEELAPYPRCLWVRDGTYDIFQELGLEFPVHKVATKIKNRTAIHISDALLGDKCEPRYLVIIKKPSEANDRVCEIKTDSLPPIKIKEKYINKFYRKCEQLGILILDVEEASVAENFYNQAPKLEEISKLTASLDLLRSFLGGYDSNAVSLIEPLAKILKPVKCYQLTPGKLDQTVEIIDDLCKS